MATIDFSSVPQFKHEPLTEPTANIRLLTVLPPTHDNPSTIGCTLEEGDLNSSYVCLSYMWGPDTNSRLILLDGQSLLIRDNLYAFLVQAQKSWNRTLPIWIDAICIDQESNAEKSAQVALMGEIYKEASEVVSWLGEKREQAIEDALVFTKIWGHEECGRQEPGAGGSEMLRKIYVDDLPLESYIEAFRHIASLEYWSRLWTVQEILLANKLTLRYGRVETPARCLENIQDYIRVSSAPDSVKERIFESYCGTTFENRYNRSLISNLVKFRNYKCEKVLDKIYALQTLGGTGNRIQVDYTTSRAHTFIQVLKRRFEDGFSVEFMVTNGFHIVQTLGFRIDELPLKVPGHMAECRWPQMEENFGRVTFQDTSAGNLLPQDTYAIEWLRRDDMRGICETIIVSPQPNSTIPYRLEDGDMLLIPQEFNICFLLRLSPTPEALLEAESNLRQLLGRTESHLEEKRLLPCGTYYLITLLRIHPDDIVMVRDKITFREGSPKSLRLIPCVDMSSWADLHPSTAFLKDDFYHPTSSWSVNNISFITLHLAWSCLLGIWKLMEEHTDLFEPSRKTRVGPRREFPVFNLKKRDPPAIPHLNKEERERYWNPDNWEDW